ncbi:hypothetical protein FUAX_40100 (plasmid) [Fulvitalea axinellae]|uniref:Uncharacterized protein n=2 Tax=Fulvitalea axinellae TaxID=1182444 RepID=A0AAU9CMU2_9BACT|nr:hypothetical protein FUAX_40100 [Fulvitalea axinellae]
MGLFLHKLGERVSNFKMHTLWVCLMVFGSCILSSCEDAIFSLKDLDNTSLGVDAKLNGDSWSARRPSAIYEGGVLRITATGSADDVLKISITALQEGGEYSFGVGEDNFASYVSGSLSYNSTSSSEASGTLIITKVDSERKVVAGSFSLKLANQIDSSDHVEFKLGMFGGINYVVPN